MIKTNSRRLKDQENFYVLQFLPSFLGPTKRHDYDRVCDGHERRFGAFERGRFSELSIENWYVIFGSNCGFLQLL